MIRKVLEEVPKIRQIANLRNGSEVELTGRFCYDDPDADNGPVFSEEHIMFNGSKNDQ